MNRTQGLAQTQEELRREGDSRWVVSLANTMPAERTGYSRWQLAGEGRARKLYVSSETGSPLPVSVNRAGLSLVLDGTLYNRSDLQNELGDLPGPAGTGDAEVILAGYERWGEDVLKRLRGAFALLLWDNSRDVLLCLRDPLGSYPLFYAQGHEELLISTSVNVLIRQPNVSRGLNRAALVDHLVDRYPRLEETSYEAVSRIPPGHVLRVTKEGRSSYRYWDPSPDGTVKWLTPDEVEQFDELFDRAVSRCLSVGPAGIFLSGGLDSVSVAAVATERCRIEGLPKPWALSLVFPDPKSNEEIVQRGVASQLGLPHVIKPFFEATGPSGLLGPALALSGSLSAPLMNTWLPAYYELALEGRRRGCKGILTGGGGDEWLTVSPYLAADLLHDFDFAGFFRLWRSMRRSFRRSSFALLRSLIWTFGAQPLVHPPAQRFVKKVAPWALTLRHRLSPRPAPWIAPKWLAPDGVLRRQFDLRREEEHASRRQTADSYYIREIRPALDHAVISWELEEIFEVYQRAGVRMLQPFWDPDLVDMLYRTPPFLLIQDGLSKGLVRGSLARRFPQLGFDRQRKVEATTFYASLIYRNGSEIWREFGGLRTLADLEIIDEGRLRPMIERLLASRKEGRKAHRIWSVLNLESWARAHVS